MGSRPASKRDQYALITYLVVRLSKAPGKKALQKLVHLIEELGGVDAGYRFSFYTYGPYSSDLTGDIDAVAGFNGIDVAYDAEENTYRITAGKKKDWVLDGGKVFLDRHAAELDRVIEKFGGRLAKDLELVSTIVYLRRHVPESFDNEAALVTHVRALKPKYTDDQMRKAFREVRAFVGRSPSA